MTSSCASRELKEDSPLIKHENILYGVIFLNTLITVMNTSMFNVALPNISDHFQINAGSASLIVSSYSIVFALSAILFTKFSSSIPIRILLTVGIVLLSIGSLIGMLSNSFPLLIAARVIQALGASSISALSIIITTRYIPTHRRGKRLGLVASAVTLGFGLGPLVGGVLTQFLGWEYLFAISLIALIGIPFYLTLLPFETGVKEVFDYNGMLLFFVAVVLLLSGITYSWIFIPLSVLVMCLYFVHINRHEFPFMQPSLLKEKSFLIIIGIGFIIFFINFSIIFLLPLILTRFFEVGNTALIGLILLPGALTASIVSIFVGKAADQFGAKKVMFFGTLFMPIAAVIASLFGNTSILFIILIFSVSSSSFVCITTSLPNILTEKLPANQLTTGIGTLQLFQYIGGGIGVTITGKLITLFKDIQLGNNEYIFVFSTLFIISLVAFTLSTIFLRSGKIQRKIIL